MTRSHCQLLWALYFGHAVLTLLVRAQPCRPGYLLKTKQDCIDVDECAEDANKCGPNKQCINAQGSYNCICLPGFKMYVNDPTRCEEVPSGRQARLRERAAAQHGDSHLPQRGDSAVPAHWKTTLPGRENATAPDNGSASVSHRGDTAVPHQRRAPVSRRGFTAVPRQGDTAVPGHWSTPVPGGGNVNMSGHWNSPESGSGNTLDTITERTSGPGHGHTPGPGNGHTPGPGNGHTPGPGNGHTPGPGIGRTPGLIIEHTPESGHEHTPEPANQHTPEPGTGRKPGQGIGHTPGQGIGHTPGQVSGPAAPTGRSGGVTTAREPEPRLPSGGPSTALDPRTSTTQHRQLTIAPRRPHAPWEEICARASNTSRLFDGLCQGAGTGLPPEDVIAYSSGILAGRSEWEDTPWEERIESASLLLTGVEEAALSWGSIGPAERPRIIANEEMDLQVVRVEGAPGGDRVRLQAGGNMAEVGWRTGTNTSASAVVAFIVYRNMESLLQGALYSNEESGGRHGDFQLQSEVISAALRLSGNSSASVAVRLVLKHQQASTTGGRVSCVYWSQAAAWHGWSTRGCVLVQSNSSHTTCHCQHLSSFAILMAFTEKLQSHRHDALSVISFIGIPVSLACLLLALATFTFCPQARNSVSATHTQLCLSLFLAELLFIVAVKRTANRIVCGVVAGCLHYLFLAAFAWMSLESFQLYVMVKNLKKMRVSSSGHTGKLVYAVGYGCPALVVTLSALIYPNGYGSQRNCWLQVENGFIWSFLGPVYFIILINTFLFTTSLYTLNEELSNRDMKVSKIKDTRMLMFKAIAHVFILGCTWILGLFHFQEETLVMAYLFTIVNSFQGTFIFIILCILNPKIRAEYQKWIFAISQTKRIFFESESTKTPLSVTSETV
ncbi:adhesion G protein-coupled receptor E3-like isoform X1 [Amblyraja radiata]|uniref:adhesion G protein-coupled receptor E3-like isoform X1 n=1 Tax=Amblyraja radiata TaxID=386614 RepID=UPI0014034EAC|nr:adhesion G protein-coupled receptor E3-like isoform X1 [Amblyraja radiata]